MKDTQIKIEAGVKMPPRHLYHKGKWKVTLEQMNKGDSFAVQPQQISAVRVSISAYKKQNKTKKDWVVRKVAADQWRCWRIA